MGDALFAKWKGHWEEAGTPRTVLGFAQTFPNVQRPSLGGFTKVPQPGTAET